MRTATLRYFIAPFAVTIAGLVLAVWLGWVQGGASGAAKFLFIAAVLSVLEISLSFDNAIVNANKLKTMTPKWRRRFLTWGILIAVFGMRIVFPLAVVAIAAEIGPWAAVMLAVNEPQEYSRIMADAHLGISAFGGAFLMMVALNYFVDENKDIDWIAALERRLRDAAAIRGLEVGLVLLIVVLIAGRLEPVEATTFLFAAVFGLLTFLMVDILSGVLDKIDEATAASKTAMTGGLGAFLYLEVLDASFSFDGVIGAFALTQNLFLIAIGLGVGAMYVRSMTIMLVERGTLAAFRYLEHGAFYSIFALALIMFAQSLTHIPEVITGLIGAVLIGAALWSSILHNRRREAQ